MILRLRQLCCHPNLILVSSICPCLLGRKLTCTCIPDRAVRTTLRTLLISWEMKKIRNWPELIRLWGSNGWRRYGYFICCILNVADLATQVKQRSVSQRVLACGLKLNILETDSSSVRLPMKRSSFRMRRMNLRLHVLSAKIVSIK